MPEKVKCQCCGETWEQETIGYLEAMILLILSDNKQCPACLEYQPN